MTPKETLASVMGELHVTVGSLFVPWSKSRYFKEGAKVTERSLNWRVVVKRDGREVITTDYTSGIGNAPSYCHRITEDVMKLLVFETEHGKAARLGASTSHVFTGKPIVPDPCDVVYSLVSDGEAIDHATFESWASDHGYCMDSRKAEATYRACLETGLKLRAALGDDGLAKLRDACREY